MAITTVNAVYTPSGPTADKQILAFGPGSSAELAYIGTATFTGDAASSSATLNYIDGTAALSFTPSAIIACRVGGAATATIGVVSVVDAGNANKTATVQFTGTVNAATIVVGFMILK
jgi:hypothetical protein